MSSREKGERSPQDQLRQAHKRLEQSEAKRSKLLQHLEALKDKTFALLSVADRNKELQQSLEQAAAARAHLEQQLAAAVESQRKAEAQAAEAKRKAQAVLRNSQLVQQQQGSMPQPAVPPLPRASSSTRSKAPTGSSSSNAAAAGVTELRGEVEDLRLKVRRLQEALKQADARTAQHASRLTLHGAQLQRLQRGAGSGAASAVPAGSVGVAAEAAGAAAWQAGGLPEQQLQQVVAAVLAQVMPLIASGQQVRDQPVQQQQQQQHGQPWGSGVPMGLVVGTMAGAGSSRAASVDPEFCTGPPPIMRQGTARHQQPHAVRLPAAAGASLGLASSAAATTHALAAATPPCRAAGTGGCSSGSLSSVMHSGVTLQDPGSPGTPGWLGYTLDVQGPPGEQLREQQQQQQEEDEEKQGARDASIGLGRSILLDSSSSSSGEAGDEEGGDICSSASGMRPPLRGKRGRCPARGDARERDGKRLQLRSPKQQQQQQQPALLRVGQHLSQLRARPAARDRQPPGNEQDEVEEAAAASKLASELAQSASRATLAQAFRAAAMSGAAATWNSNRLEGDHHPEDLGLLGWATDAGAESLALRRLARCARKLLARLAPGDAAALEVALVAHLRAALGIAARGSSGGCGTMQAPGGELLPLQCAAAAALLHLLRELGRAAEARAVMSDLLLLHEAQQRAAAAAPGVVRATGVPVLPLMLSAVAAWPQVLLLQLTEAPLAAGGPSDAAAASHAAVARDPSLAVLHAGLWDACAAAVAAAEDEVSDDEIKAAGSPSGTQQQQQQHAPEDVAAAFVLQAVGPGWWGACWTADAWKSGAGRAGSSDGTRGGQRALLRVVGILRVLRCADAGDASNGQATAGHVCFAEANTLASVFAATMAALP